MEINERIIQLTFNRKDFEEIYFRDQQGSIFLNPRIRKVFVIFLITLLLFLASLRYSQMTNKLIFLTVLTFLALVVASILYFRQALAILKWRRDIERYISETSRIREHTLVVNTHSISLIQDTVEIITKWSSCTGAKFEEDFIWLFANENHLFPRKSMSPEDYNYLKEVIKERTKNG